ncbi:MAG: S8 family serine peptidase [Armatimonadota bacterium]
MLFRFMRHPNILNWFGITLVFVMLMLAVASNAATQQTVTLRIPETDLPKLSKIEVLNRIDYGGFSVIEVPASAVETLKAAKTRFQEEKDAGVIKFQDRSFDVRKGVHALPKALSAAESPGSPMFYLIHLKGPLKSDWAQEIEKSGGRIVSYIPENTYLVWVDPSKASGLGSKQFIEWRSPYHPAYKIQKKLDGVKGKIEYLSVTIYDDPSDATINEIKSMGAKLVKKLDATLDPDNPAVNAWFTADASIIQKIARLPRVLQIEKTSAQYGLDDEVACQINAGNYTAENYTSGVPFSDPPYASWLSQVGFDGSGSIVAVIDTGCDTNDLTTMHADLAGRILSVESGYPFVPATDTNGHGTHVAGIIAGTAALGVMDENGFLYGQGVAPGCSLYIQPAVLAAQFPPMDGWGMLTRDSVRSGAFVSNNSWYWGSETGQGYTAICREFDSLVRDADRQTSGTQQIAMVFSSGNAGPNATSLYDPKEAKNIITVGASENYRLDMPLGSGGGSSTDIDGVASFSSRGPCVDGRLAPTIVAPGTNISSMKSYSADNLGKYDDPNSPYQKVIDGAEDYAWMSGTSQAAPAVSGALAVIGQWWRLEHNNSNPSAAMCKAILVNSAKDIAGGPDGRDGGSTLGHIPNSDQGWGRLDLEAALDPPDTYYEDQEYLFTETGQTRSYRVVTSDPSKPLKVTLVWSDAPGTVGASAWVNDLDLTVTKDSSTYLGNDFSGGWSTVGGSRDYKNNIECVYFPNPSGVYWITVTAANIAGDGVLGNSSTYDQDYAIIVRNGIVGGNKLQSYTPVTISSASTTDYYAASGVSCGWCAVGIRPANGSDYDLQMFSDAGYTNSTATSDTRGGSIDFIAVDCNRTVPSLLYPKVTSYAGISGYNIEWATRLLDLNTGTLYVTNFNNNSVLKVWDMSVSKSGECCVLVNPGTGLDIGVSVVGSMSDDPTTYYKSRQNSIAESDTAGLGGAERLIFQLPAEGRYGLIVWKKAGAGTATVKFDDDPPTQPIVSVPSSYITDLTSISASWQSEDPDTGIAKYEYAIGSSQGAKDVLDWTDAGTSTQVTKTGLSLVSGQEYFITVRATNGIGMTSQGSSSSIFAANHASDIADVKALPDGFGVLLDAKVVTAVFSGKFYIEEDDRHSGIGVLWDGDVEEGSSVSVIGKLVIIAGERFIEALPGDSVVAVTPITE